MYLFTLPILGLMVVFFWMSAASRLIDGLYYYKDRIALVLLMILFIINIPAIPSILNYEWLKTTPGPIFYAIDLTFLVVVYSIYRGNNLIFIYYMICSLYLSIFSLGILDNKSIYSIYLSFVIIFPLIHYFVISGSNTPEQVIKHIEKKNSNDIINSDVEINKTNINEEDMIECPNCKNYNAKDNLYCCNCGTKLHESEIINNKEKNVKNDTEIEITKTNNINTETNKMKEKNLENKKMIECPGCKKKNTDGNYVCVYCGYKLKEKDNG
ncbi:MAG: hypothetical protein VZS44_03955 [Bacilli bacterium]|nr:hypothetical protein [Bacilli bacterium]